MCLHLQLKNKASPPPAESLKPKLCAGSQLQVKFKQEDVRWTEEREILQFAAEVCAGINILKGTGCSYEGGIM